VSVFVTRIELLLIVVMEVTGTFVTFGEGGLSQALEEGMYKTFFLEFLCFFTKLNIVKIQGLHEF